jgi:hypothetical protein
MFSAYARNVLANLPKAYGNDRRSTVYEPRSSLRTLVRNQRWDTARECLSDACSRENRQRGRGCTYANFNTPVDEAGVP